MSVWKLLSPLYLVYECVVNLFIALPQDCHDNLKLDVLRQGNIAINDVTEEQEKPINIKITENLPLNVPNNILSYKRQKQQGKNQLLKRKMRKCKGSMYRRGIFEPKIVSFRLKFLKKWIQPCILILSVYLLDIFCIISCFHDPEIITINSNQKTKPRKLVK